MMGGMEPASTVDFAQAARTIARHARRAGLSAPSFRCPPRLVGADRTIRRRRDGAVVSVRVRDRPVAAVLADMIEGAVVANRLTPPQSDRMRADLWDALETASRFAARVRDAA
jgi:hypothetical protein